MTLNLVSQSFRSWKAARNRCSHSFRRGLWHYQLLAYLFVKSLNAKRVQGSLSVLLRYTLSFGSYLA